MIMGGFMKRILLVLLACMFVFTSCDSNGPEYGELRFVESTSRGIESITMDTERYDISGEGPSGQSFSLTDIAKDKVGDQRLTLLAGDWSVKAIAKNVEGIAIGEGTSTCTVEGGKSAVCLIEVKEYEGEGTLCINVEAASPVESGISVKVFRAGDTNELAEIALEKYDDLYACTIDLSNGFYELHVYVDGKFIEPLAGRVVKDQTTVLKATYIAEGGNPGRLEIEDAIVETPQIVLSLANGSEVFSNVGLGASAEVRGISDPASLEFSWYVAGKKVEGVSGPELNMSAEDLGLTEGTECNLIVLVSSSGVVWSESTTISVKGMLSFPELTFSGIYDDYVRLYSYGIEWINPYVNETVESGSAIWLLNGVVVSDGLESAEIEISEVGTYSLVYRLSLGGYSKDYVVKEFTAIPGVNPSIEATSYITGEPMILSLSDRGFRGIEILSVAAESDLGTSYLSASFVRSNENYSFYEIQQSLDSGSHRMVLELSYDGVVFKENIGYIQIAASAPSALNISCSNTAVTTNDSLYVRLDSSSHIQDARLIMDGTDVYYVEINGGGFSFPLSDVAVGQHTLKLVVEYYGGVSAESNELTISVSEAEQKTPDCLIMYRCNNSSSNLGYMTFEIGDEIEFQLDLHGQDDYFNGRTVSWYLDDVPVIQDVSHSSKVSSSEFNFTLGEHELSVMSGEDLIASASAVFMPDFDIVMEKGAYSPDDVITFTIEGYDSSHEYSYSLNGSSFVSCSGSSITLDRSLCRTYNTLSLYGRNPSCYTYSNVVKTASFTYFDDAIYPEVIGDVYQRIAYLRNEGGSTTASMQTLVITGDNTFDLYSASVGISDYVAGEKIETFIQDPVVEKGTFTIENGTMTLSFVDESRPDETYAIDGTRLISDRAEFTRLNGTSASSSVNGYWKMTEINPDPAVANAFFDGLLDSLLEDSISLKLQEYVRFDEGEGLAVNAYLSITDTQLNAYVPLEIGASLAEGKFSLPKLFDPYMTFTGELSVSDSGYVDVSGWKSPVKLKVSSDGSVMLAYVPIADGSAIPLPLVRCEAYSAPVLGEKHFDVDYVAGYAELMTFADEVLSALGKDDELFDLTKSTINGISVSGGWNVISSDIEEFAASGDRIAFFSFAVIRERENACKAFSIDSNYLNTRLWGRTGEDACYEVTKAVIDADEISITLKKTVSGKPYKTGTVTLEKDANMKFSDCLSLFIDEYGTVDEEGNKIEILFGADGEIWMNAVGSNDSANEIDMKIGSYSVAESSIALKFTSNDFAIPITNGTISLGIELALENGSEIVILDGTGGNYSLKLRPVNP